MSTARTITSASKWHPDLPKHLATTAPEGAVQYAQLCLDLLDLLLNDSIGRDISMERDISDDHLVRLIEVMFNVRLSLYECRKFSGIHMHDYLHSITEECYQINQSLIDLSSDAATSDALHRIYDAISKTNMGVARDASVLHDWHMTAEVYEMALSSCLLEVLWLLLIYAECEDKEELVGWKTEVMAYAVRMADVLVDDFGGGLADLSLPQIPVQRDERDPSTAVQLQPEVLVYGAELAYKRGDTALCRRIIQYGRAVWPADGSLLAAERLFAPPTTRILPSTGERRDRAGMEASQRWLARYGAHYRGQWVALRDGDLLAHARTLAEIRARLGGLPSDVLATRIA